MTSRDLLENSTAAPPASVVPVPSLMARALGGVLRHPATRTARRAARDVWWRVKGHSIRNPPVPANPRAILFVCLGNICRSPFAERVATARLREFGQRPAKCASAGIRTTQAAEPPPEAKLAARRYGVSLDRHRPQQLTKELVSAYDMIIVMESSQAESLRRLYAECHDRVFLLPLFDQGAAGFDRFHIVDPFSQPLTAFEHCYHRIDRAVLQLIEGIARTRTAASHAKVSQR
jgi:protein-tyrosine phosphatase